MIPDPKGPAAAADPTPAAPGPGVSLKPGEPAPRGTYEGRAHAFREHQAERRKEQRSIVGQILVVVILILGVYAIIAVRPFNPASQSTGPTPGPPIVVSLSSPAVRTLTCGNGGMAYAERITWTGATAPVATGDISVHVFETVDGDFIPDLNAVANVTPTSLCAGAPPDPTFWLWYVVLSAPNGTVLLTYTITTGWQAVESGAWNIPVETNSTLTVITGRSASNTGLGFAVVGYANGSSIRGSVVL